MLSAVIFLSLQSMHGLAAPLSRRVSSFTSPLQWINGPVKPADSASPWVFVRVLFFKEIFPISLTHHLLKMIGSWLGSIHKHANIRALNALVWHNKLSRNLISQTFLLYSACVCLHPYVSLPRTLEHYLSKVTLGRHSCMLERTWAALVRTGLLAALHLIWKWWCGTKTMLVYKAVLLSRQ